MAPLVAQLMMQLHRIYPLFLLALAGSGCWGHHEVFEVSARDNGGIPFLPIVTLAKTTTVYGQRWIEISVTGTFHPELSKAELKKGVKPSEFTKTVVAITTTPAQAATIYSQFMMAGDLVKAWSVSGLFLTGEIAAARMSAFPPNPVKAADLHGMTPLAISRTRVQAPADVPLHMNVRAPNGGTANAAVELNENGTLAKATAEKQDQLPGTVLSALGSIASSALGSDALTAVATHFYPPPATPNSVGGQTITKIDFKMVEVQRTYSVTVLQAPGAPVNCDQDGRDADCQKSIAVSIERGDSAKDSPDDSEDEAGKVKFSGSLSLPKEPAKK